MGQGVRVRVGKGLVVKGNMSYCNVNGGGCDSRKGLRVHGLG